MKDVLYIGNEAYAKIDTTNSLIKKMIEKYEFHSYAFGIICPKADKQTKEANKNTYWQRVPDLDKDVVVISQEF